MAAIKKQEVDDVLVLSFTSSKLLDEHAIRQVGKELSATALEVEEEQKIVLSFQGVDFMSSAMLGKLVTFKKQCKDKTIQLKVCSITPEIMEVFRITKLNKVFEIVKDEEKAIASFNKKGWFR